MVQYFFDLRWNAAERRRSSVVSDATRRPVEGDLVVKTRVAEFWREGVSWGGGEKRDWMRIMAILREWFMPFERERIL